MSPAKTILAIAFLAVLASAPATAQSGSTLDAEWIFETDAAHSGRTLHAALRVKVKPPFHVHSNKPLDEYLIPTELTLEPPAGFAVTQIVYPDPIMMRAQFSEGPLSVFESSFAIGVAFDVAEDVTLGSHELNGTLRYQACDDKICLAPTTLRLEEAIEIVPATTTLTPSQVELFDAIAFRVTPDVTPTPTTPTTSDPPGASSNQQTPTTTDDCDVIAELDGFTVVATAGGYLGVEDFVQFLDDAEAGIVRSNPLEGKTPLVIVLLVAIGGIALNLTPCVLPLIPINLAIIGAGAQAGSRARGFALGGTYGLAMAVVYGGLGLLVILTASTFGAINSTIWFNVAIAVLFVVLALAMFDLILIDFSKFQGKLDVAGHGRRGSFALAFGMGAVSALLAGACVAPVVIQVIVYAGDQYSRGVTIALALPFFLGLGMALPWPFAGAGLSFLPKPGTWMVRVKQAMGVFILAFAVYYGYLAWEIYQERRVVAGAVASEHDQHLEEGWTSSMCDGMSQARDEDRLVFVDMWATWCKNCLAMDKTTFRDEQVVTRLGEFVKVKYQAEDLEASPAREMLERFEGIGLPMYAVLRPKTAAP